jgi:hypothetical protein
MISTFYVVQKDGIPAVWQASPKRLVQLLKRKAGFTLAIEAPAETRRQALGKLRELFPQHRPVKAATQELH